MTSIDRSKREFNEFNKKRHTAHQFNCICQTDLYEHCFGFDYEDKENPEFKKLKLIPYIVVGSVCIRTVRLIKEMQLNPAYKKLLDIKMNQWEASIKKCYSVISKMAREERKNKCKDCKIPFENYYIGIVEMSVCKTCYNKKKEKKEIQEKKKEKEEQDSKLCWRTYKYKAYM